MNHQAVTLIASRLRTNFLREATLATKQPKWVCDKLPNLMGACAILSSYLYQALDLAQAKLIGSDVAPLFDACHFVYNKRHCFLLIDGFIVDCTANQFQYCYDVEDIHIVPASREKRAPWELVSLFRYIKDAHAWMTHSSWPKSQMAPDHYGYPDVVTDTVEQLMPTLRDLHKNCCQPA